MHTQPASAKTAVITGASGGIGEATARALAASGFNVVLGARRLPQLQKIAKEIGGTALELDVTDEHSVAQFASQIQNCDVLINNAGGALGKDTVQDANLEHWQTMYDTNVIGTLRVTKALLPKLEASGDGLLVLIGSIAGVDVYPGGAGYTAAKHAANAMFRTLRLELLGKPIRITEIAPGAVQTDFSLVRFEGDEEKAAAVYAGLTPLEAEDVAEVVVFVASRPAHVNLDYITVKPRDQASAMFYNRD